MSDLLNHFLGLGNDKKMRIIYQFLLRNQRLFIHIKSQQQISFQNVLQNQINNIKKSYTPKIPPQTIAIIDHSFW